MTSSSGLYRKLKKLLEGQHFRDCYAEVVEQMRPYFAGNLTYSQKNEILLRILTIDDTPFPQLMAHLQGVGHDGTTFFDSVLVSTGTWLYINVKMRDPGITGNHR